MGFRIDCPNCGSRPYSEFAYDGEVKRTRREGADVHAADFDRVWMRENAAGLQVERWFHAAGCRRWLTVERDTVTNDVRSVS